MFDTILKIVEAALSIWDSKEKTRYSDELILLKKAWYEEYNKDQAIRSDAVLGNIWRELCILSDRIATDILGATVPNQH